jgi:hypothetical protein
MSGSDEPPKPNVSPDPTFGAIAAFKAAGDAFDIAYDVEESADDRTRRAAQLALDAASDTLKATRETERPADDFRRAGRIARVRSHRAGHCRMAGSCQRPRRGHAILSHWRDRFAPWRGCQSRRRLADSSFRLSRRLDRASCRRADLRDVGRVFFLCALELRAIGSSAVPEVERPSFALKAVRTTPKF